MFLKLNEFFSNQNLYNIRVNFETMQVYLMLDVDGNNKSGKFSECYSKLDDIKTAFDVKFCFRNFKSLQYMTLNCDDSPLIKEKILKLSIDHEFYFCDNFSDKKEDFKPVLIDVKKEISKCKGESLKIARLKNYKDCLIKECRVITLKIKSDYDEKIILSDADLDNISENFAKYGPDVKTVLLKAEYKPRYSSNYYLKAATSLQCLQYFEAIGVKIDKTQDNYKRIIKLDIFSKLDNK